MSTNRVLQIMAGALHGGAEAFFVRLVKGLAEAGLSQQVIIRPGDGRESDLTKAGLTVTPAPFRSLADFSTKPRIRAVTQSFDPNITLAWMSRAAAMTPHPGKGRILAARLGGFYHLKYFRHCDHWIGNTKSIVDWMAAQGLPRDRLHYLPNFTDAQKASPIARADLNTQEDAAVILALGRFHDDKAFDVLIPALAQVPGAILWLGGEGPRENDLRRQAINLGVNDRIRWLGWRKDVAALAASADVLCCPSRVEPLGNVVLEAWGYGLPVVAANSSGPAELITSARNGILVPQEDADSLARALTQVLENKALAQDLAQAAENDLAARFSRAAVVASYLEFFDQVGR
jgi:glycosyltransferase involved in cell wall biosynthesis